MWMWRAQVKRRGNPDTKEMLEQSFEHLLSLVGTRRIVGPVTTSPLEPLSGSPPGVWLGAAAFHLADTWRECDNIISQLERWLAANKGSGKDIAISAWGSLGDLRFHSFYFPLYSELIREQLLKSEKTEEGRYVWAFAERKACCPLSVELFERRLAEEITIPKSERQRIARDLSDLSHVCKVASKAIEGFALQSHGPFHRLSQSFVEVQCAILQLALVLLRADVATTLLMYYSKA